MAIPSTQDLRMALNSDLRKMSPNGLEDVVNDAVRQLFTARMAGAVLEFAHKQSDGEFWCGVKYYGSGSQSRIRVRRTAIAEMEVSPARAVRKPKAKVPRAKTVGAEVAGPEVATIDC